MRDQAVVRALAHALDDIGRFSELVVPERALRPYQAEPAREILRSIEEKDGRTFVVMMPRQSGKNELSAQLEADLLTTRLTVGASLVKAAPTFKPQVVNSIRRLRDILTSPLTRPLTAGERGYIVKLGRATIAFFSAEPSAQVVGATAATLLEGDEAEDIAADKWDKDRPMGATSVLYGTPWVDDLLARTLAECEKAQTRDGKRRVFVTTWHDVAHANPHYGAHVEKEIARLGESHPIVKTQYLLSTLPWAGRFLDEQQLASLLGEHQPAAIATAGRRYVAGIDVAGQDEDDPTAIVTKVNPKRDSTVVTIAELDPTSLIGAAVEPRLSVMAIYAWIGTAHRELYPKVLAIVQAIWRCERVVVDATGIGGGLAAFLGAALGPTIAEPFTFTQASKSELAYDLLDALNGKRLQVYAESSDEGANAARRELLRQAAAADYELRAHQAMAFAVPEHRGHDDHLMSLALVNRAASWTGLRRAVGRPSRHSSEQPFGNERRGLRR